MNCSSEGNDNSRREGRWTGTSLTGNVEGGTEVGITGNTTQQHWDAADTCCCGSGYYFAVHNTNTENICTLKKYNNQQYENKYLQLQINIGPTLCIERMVFFRGLRVQLHKENIHVPIAMMPDSY